jgi:2-polyprenyl-3-methyl-5-hydroxy-6-metoxy-1,4-benzoquinol methylase
VIFERTECPVCRSNELRELSTVNCRNYAAYDPAFPEDKTWVGCTNCSHLFSRQAWDRDTFRESLSRPVYGADEGWNEARWMDAHEIVHRLASRVAADDPTLVELGCGKAYLSGAASDMGIPATAVDPHPCFEVYAKNIGCKFMNGFYEELDIPPHDIVTLGDVLEHCSDLHEAVDKIPAKENGIVHVSTPLYDLSFYRVTGWGGMYIVVDHLHFFSRESLRRLFTLHGWNLVDHKISRSYKGCIEWTFARS